MSPHVSADTVVSLAQYTSVIVEEGAKKGDAATVLSTEYGFH